MLFLIEDLIKNIFSFIPLFDLFLIFLKYNIISFNTNTSTFIFFKLFKILNSIDLYDKFKRFMIKHLKKVVFIFLNLILKLSINIDNDDLEEIRNKLVETNKSLRTIINKNKIRSSILKERKKSRSPNKKSSIN